LDGDGKPDLAVANFRPATVPVLRNTGRAAESTDAGSFAAKVEFWQQATCPISVAIGDLDGDWQARFGGWLIIAQTPFRYFAIPVAAVILDAAFLCGQSRFWNRHSFPLSVSPRPICDWRW